MLHTYRYNSLPEIQTINVNGAALNRMVEIKYMWGGGFKHVYNITVTAPTVALLVVSIAACMASLALSGRLAGVPSTTDDTTLASIAAFVPKSSPGRHLLVWLQNSEVGVRVNITNSTNAAKR